MNENFIFFCIIFPSFYFIHLLFFCLFLFSFLRFLTSSRKQKYLQIDNFNLAFYWHGTSFDFSFKRPLIGWLWKCWNLWNQLCPCVLLFFCVALASGDASSVIAFCLPRVADRFFFGGVRDLILCYELAETSTVQIVLKETKQTNWPAHSICRKPLICIF